MLQLSVPPPFSSLIKIAIEALGKLKDLVEKEGINHRLGKLGFFIGHTSPKRGTTKEGAGVKRDAVQASSGRARRANGPLKGFPLHLGCERLTGSCYRTEP